MKTIILSLTSLMVLILCTLSACRKEYITVNNIVAHDTTYVHDTIRQHDTLYVVGNDTIAPDSCDPDTVYFVNDILPLLQLRCAPCHSGSNPPEDIDVTSYSNIMSADEFVTPNNLGDSDLYEVITTSDHDDRMPPPPYSALTTTEINLIRTWILQGARNNECQH